MQSFVQKLLFLQPMRKKVTIHDIAKKLGVTASTVSRALNNHPRISESTRKKVLKAAHKLNYTPNVLASNLRKGKANTLGLCIPRVNRHFFANIINGVEKVTNKMGYNVVICQSNERAKTEVQNIHTLLNNRVDGIIISHAVETTSFEHLQEVIDSGIPLIQFDRVNSALKTFCIVNDNEQGAYKTALHLLNKGYRKIAYFGGPTHINVYRERKQGFFKALKEFNITPNPEMVFENVITRLTGEEVAKKLLNSADRPDAIFAASDYSALGAYLVCKEMGISIPQEMGITGSANEPFTELIDPSLTSLEQHGISMGEKIAELMIELCEDDEKTICPETIYVPIELIERQSTNRS